jgi:hypothetical protein
MPVRMPSRCRAICAFACALVAAAPLVGCGDDSGSSGAGGDGVVRSQPAPPKSAFPSAAGKTLQEVVKEADAPAPLVVSPAAMAFEEGANRFPFGVFEPDRSPVSDAEVALYISKVPRTKPGAKPGEEEKGATARAQKEALEAPAIGPFPAAIESMETKPAFRAQTTTSDPDAATVVYVAQLPFTSDGEWRIAALIRDDGELTASLLPSAAVGEFATIPRPGERAPLIHTPTAEDAGGDLSEITTRVPPDTQNQVDFADVLGKEPIVLLFATPQFCESRVCGPVVDVAEQVKEEYGEEAEFIHMEIWENNDPGTKRPRPQVKAYRLPTEPWLFVIDRQGVIRTAIEGAFGVERLTRAVEEVTAE